MTTNTGLVATLEADGKAVEAFLEAEGSKVIAWASTALKPVEEAFTDLVNDAKGQADTLLTAAESAMSQEIQALEADFETAIANALQKVSGGSTTALLTELGASGVQALATQAEALVGPLFVKVLAALSALPTTV